MSTFSDLCERPLAAADYLALASSFGTVAVADVPLFGGANLAAAYRFVTLVDVLYEHRWAGTGVHGAAAALAGWRPEQRGAAQRGEAPCRGLLVWCQVTRCCCLSRLPQGASAAVC
jgi:predicted ATPase